MRIPEQLKQSLELLSQASDRSQSQIANKAISEYVEKNEWKVKAIQEAKNSAKTGVFTSKSAVSDWLESWGTDTELVMPKADIFPN